MQPASPIPEPCIQEQVKPPEKDCHDVATGQALGITASQIYDLSVTDEQTPEASTGHTREASASQISAPLMEAVSAPVGGQEYEDAAVQISSPTTSVTTASTVDPAPQATTGQAREVTSAAMTPTAADVGVESPAFPALELQESPTRPAQVSCVAAESEGIEGHALASNSSPTAVKAIQHTSESDIVDLTREDEPEPQSATPVDVNMDGPASEERIIDLT